MTITIGILASVSLVNRLKAYEDILKKESNIIFIPYESLSDIKSLFIKNMPIVDAFIFGGELGFLTISNDLKSKIPCFYLDVSVEETYKLLLKLATGTNKFDFSRVYIDFLTEANNYIGLKEILPENNFPYTYSYGDLDHIYERALNRHTELWKKGLIDISITRLGNLENILRDMGIKTFYVSPSIQNVLNTLTKAINSVKIRSLGDNLIAIGCISIHGIKSSSSIFNYEEEVNLLALNKALIDFEHKYNLPHSIKRNDASFEIIISKKILKELTDNYKSCSILNYIKPSNIFNVNIGWGISSTIMEARKKSKMANIEASNYNENCSFIVNEHDRVIGPLSEYTSIHIADYYNSQIETISKKAKLSSVTILKLIGITSKLNTNEVSSDDLSFYMGITVRSANRILNKLCESGFAKPIDRNSNKLVGRPQKIYLLCLNNDSKH